MKLLYYVGQKVTYWQFSHGLAYIFNSELLESGLFLFLGPDIVHPEDTGSYIFFST